MPFTLPSLPFASDALEPHMSRTTLETHHGKHHAAYITKMNAAIARLETAPATLEDLVRYAASEGDKPLFNNAAQAWNHAFFWQCLTPQQTEPQGALKAAIEKTFGGLDAFRTEARARGEAHFASGWVWLVADETGALALRDTHDADTPILDNRVTPLVVCDVWEHAYYLDYKNERGKFLEAFFAKLINWGFVETQYEAARNGGAGAWAFPS